MRLVDGIGEIITELIKNSLDPGVVLAGDELAVVTLACFCVLCVIPWR
jgi:hypothetical protein